MFCFNYNGQYMTGERPFNITWGWGSGKGKWIQCTIKRQFWYEKKFQVECYCGWMASLRLRSHLFSHILYNCNFHITFSFKIMGQLEHHSDRIMSLAWWPPDKLDFQTNIPCCNMLNANVDTLKWRMAFT